MLHTRLCGLLGIKHPIIQASLGPITTPELVAAVSNAGGLGSIGAAERSAADLRYQIARTLELTERPFAINLVPGRCDEGAFTAAFESRPAVISFALGDPGESVKRAHDVGAIVMHQVHTRQQAEEAAERGVDVVIAQGSEAGGNCGSVAALVLIPQVVRAVAPIPVVAAGSIADGSGLAAALVLGALGVNIGTRFVASEEAGSGVEWKRAIVEAESEQAVKVESWNEIFPRKAPGGYDAAPRALRTSFIDELQRQVEIQRDAARLREILLAAVREGQMHQYVPLAGQTVGLIHEILPARKIIERMVAEAESSLREVCNLLA